MRIVVTGKSGQVAKALAERGREHGAHVVTIGRPEFDLTRADEGLGKIAEALPDVIVSAAAYTAVDRAEVDAERAHIVNAEGPSCLAELAASLAVPLIHLSTDYVFDGTKTSPYHEQDETNPLNVYGTTKLAGEQAVAAAGTNHVILRTAWIYSAFGANFLKTMLRAAGDRKELKVVDDQIGNPTSALDIADAIFPLARNLVDNPHDQELRGIFHLAGGRDTSWAAFASRIFEVSAQLGGPTARVQRISTLEYPTAARRPMNSRLATDKLRRVHRVLLPDWHSSIAAAVSRVLDGGS